MGNGGIQECERITHVLWCVSPEFYDITHITYITCITFIL